MFKNLFSKIGLKYEEDIFENRKITTQLKMSLSLKAEKYVIFLIDTMHNLLTTSMKLLELGKFIKNLSR